MSRSSWFRVLVVDDFGPWRRFTSTTLQTRSELRVIGEACDGLQAVQKAQELQPDLILLDIALPKLNGIEAARRIRKLSPSSKILFVSDNRYAEIAEEALSTGAQGYIVKPNAARELLPAVSAILRGERFISADISHHDLTEATDVQTGTHPQHKALTFTPPQRSASRHDVFFYSDDRDLVNNVTQYIGAALKAGNAAIVVATESHIRDLLPSLRAYGVDVDAVIEQGRYVTADAADTVSSFVVDGTLDRARFLDTVCSLILAAAKAVQGDPPRVAIFGEGAYLLWAQGNFEAAIEDERVCNQLVREYDIDILCGYSVGLLPAGMEPHFYQQICEEHSGVYSL